MKERKLELLAPVGGTEHLRAAVQAGADAVYLGGKLFNARINADNFDDAEMREGVDYAHLRGVKVYVTMNTLLRDEDLEPALKYAAELYNMGVDALIIQDLGFASLVRKYIPGFEIHLSTQGTVYNPEGVNVARELGFSRVVLARELTLAEIADCCKVGPEIEVFVHGALCICYSGQCNMSKFNGGRSGNQGMCAQPCRLNYTSEKGETKHFLSPKDSCAIDQLGALIDAGVTSFKIEGRMKSPEYVSIVTGIYRKYIDLYTENGFYTVEDEDRQKLLQAFNRGGFTDGYLMGRLGPRMMAMDVPKHQGVLIGHTIRKAYQNLVEIELIEGAKLNMGDGVEIHNRELSGNVVTYIKPSKSGNLIIGDINGYIKGGEAVYKITDKELNNAATQLTKSNQRIRPIEISVSLHIEEPAYIELRDWNGITVGLSFDDIIPELPLKQALSHSRVREQLSKCGDYPYEISEIELEMDDNLTLPISALNRMRREALEALISAVVESYREGRNAIIDFDFKPELSFDDRSIIYAYKKDPEGKYGSHNSLVLGTNKEKLVILPIEEDSEGDPVYLCGVSKGKLDEWLRITAPTIKRTVFAGNLGQIGILREEGVPFVADYRMNITNHAGLEVMLALGASSTIEALEYRTDVKGLIPMMITEQPLSSVSLQSKIREKNGLAPMKVTRSPLGDKTYILGTVE